MRTLRVRKTPTTLSSGPGAKTSKGIRSARYAVRENVSPCTPGGVSESAFWSPSWSNG